MNMNGWLTAAFTRTQTKTYILTNDALALVTIVSVANVALETVPSFEIYSYWFGVIEWVTVVIFSAEYAARWYVTRSAWRYPLSFFGLIDLLAILPTFIGLGNFTFLKSARSLRIIRLLRILRLAKLSRRSLPTAESSVAVLGLNMAIYAGVLLTAMITTGTLIYLGEANEPAFRSIPAGMWWSFKVFMGGMEVVAPSTAFGDFVYALGRFLGLLLFGLLVGVVGNILRRFLTPDTKTTP